MNIQKVIVRNNQRNAANPVGIDASLKLERAIEEYLHCKAGYAPVASIRYKNRLMPFVQYIGRSRNISMITISDIVNYHGLMRSNGYSLKTVEYSNIIIKNFFRFWQGRGIKTLNPLEIRSIRCTSPDKELITQDDFEKMSEVLDERFFEELARKLAIHLLWDCGMRVSELCDLNISDIEETKNPGIRCAKIRRRKTMKYNIVVWGQETNRLLNLYLGLRLCLNHPTDALFITRKRYNNRLTVRTVQRWVKEIAEMAMIDKNFTPHCFRHSKAHRILDKGENIRDVQCILGHSSPISSFHYLGLNRERQLDISEKYLDQVHIKVA